MDQTMCPWMRVVYFAALQQIILNADRTIFERVIRDRSGTTQVSLSSQFWLPSLTRMCCGGCGRTLRFLEEEKLPLS